MHARTHARETQDAMRIARTRFELPISAFVYYALVIGTSFFLTVLVQSIKLLRECVRACVHA